MDQFEAQQILEEFATREQLLPPQSLKSIDFDQELFDKQQEFIKSPAKRKALLCGRRSGKSYAAAYYLIKTAYEKPKAECTYLALTLKSAKKTILPVLQEIIGRFRIPAEYNYSDLTYYFHNGSAIRLIGADMEKVQDRLRGISYDLNIVDEAQAFGDHLESLISNVLIPAARERKGTICLIGTPDIVCNGLFYEVTTNKKPNWVSWKWNLTENKYYSIWRNKKNWKELALKELDLICEEEGLTKDSDTFRREYLGEWVEGAHELVYRFSYEFNTYDKLPEDLTWYYLFGVDFGITDASALLVAAYSYSDNSLYVVDEFKQSQLTPEALAKLVKMRYDAFSPVSVVCDGNGIGAAFISQIRAMYELPIDLAEKKDKVAFIELLNDDLKAGKLKINNRCKELLQEITAYKWADPILKVLPEIANDHLLDALLYLWRRSQHFQGQIETPKPKPTDKEYSSYLVAQELDRVKEQANKEWWEE